MRYFFDHQDNAGFTLIELLIALAISSIFLAGVIQIFSTSSTSYSLQEDMATMQQNIRVGKMFIERDVRMAGCGMSNALGAAGNIIYPIDFTDGGTTGSDTLTIRYIDLNSMSCAGSAPPPVTLSLDMQPSSSSVANVNQNLNNSPYDIWKNGFYCPGNPSCDSSGFCTAQGGLNVYNVIITSPDGKRSDVLDITNVVSSNKLQANASQLWGGQSNKILNTYPSGSTISFFNVTSLTSIVYSYNSSDGTLHRTLCHANTLNTACSPVNNSTTTIAENIEDLQFAFGLDTTASGSVDTWVNSADLTTTQQPQVRLVRVNILGRTAHQHPGQTSTRPAIENHTAATVADHYSRQLLTTTVEVRNMR